MTGCESPTHPSHWQESSVRRDTTTYTLGVMSEAILVRAPSDREIMAHYRHWIRRCGAGELPSGSVETLLTTGIGAATVTLLARDVEHEFCLDSDHAEFRAVVAVGFDLAERTLSGVYVASFHGNESAAAAFASSLARAVKTNETTPRSLQPLTAARAKTKPKRSS
ncbi:MAG: hypothetical protein AAGF12_12440 [Myxococcota bacterium]